LVPLFLANPQLYKKDIAPTGVSAKERPENEQLRCPGAVALERDAPPSSADPAERAPVPSYRR